MLIGKIERFLRETGMSPTRFGRHAMRDPRFVWDLRNGREPGRKTQARIERFIIAQGKDHHAN